ncbi:LINE-1 retrotransposable element ORF1 protein [Dissostichus eleginoides]|uniref:LINE-1 retrotransposable element ORF1 protein n=1 Tax=Dissostichus eleginoides TaxID=100907 RepID=A0AAD9EWW6_DISEL|nr:LINE-1 retrotransposable element ORF1 protein [Dissostichus eleginoides]
MSAAAGKSTKGRTKSLQSKLENFGASKLHVEAKESVASSSIAPAMAAVETGETGLGEAGYGKILAAIGSLKSDFSTRLDGILTAIEGVRKEVRECSDRIAEAEVRISSTEDDVSSLQTKVKTLEAKNTKLEDKVEDLEARSRLSNLRLVNLPEDAEEGDACAFLENWIPDVLNLDPLRSKFILESAHRIGQRRDANAPPRTFIMKFLKYRDRMVVTDPIQRPAGEI